MWVIYIYYRMYSRMLSENGLDNQDKNVCYNLHLNDEQLKICLTEPEILKYVSKGTRNGIDACQYQFYNERWNCSNNNENKKLYKKRKFSLFPFTNFFYSVIHY